MKKSVFHLFLLAGVLLAGCPSLQATNSLKVGDPKKGNWSYKTGAIDQATLSIRPKGLYLEYGLYLTFSDGDQFAAGDSLEVVLDFELPEQAIVHDSWLWIGNDIIRAKILDRLTAGTIYEGIVKRRQDPSILSKLSATQYQLRVFPMRGDETRRVKITWLMPTDWTAKAVRCPVPVSLMKLSKTAVPKLELLYFAESGFGQPVIDNEPGIVFSATSGPVLGDYSRAEILPAHYSKSLNLRFSSPMKNGIYLATNDSGDDGFYQMAFLPALFLPAQPGRKLAILIDLEEKTYNETEATVLANLRTWLHAGLTPADSFNIFYSNVSISSASSGWLPADSAIIEQAIASAGSLLGGFSNLIPLMVEGIEFVQNQATGGEILLIQNSSQYTSVAAANSVVDGVLALLSDPIRVHSLDLYGGSGTWVQNNQYVYGNSYLASQLATKTGGEYQTSRQIGAKLAFSNLFNLLETKLEAADLHTSMTGGFTFGRFEFSNGSGSLLINRPGLFLGRFKGGFPFGIELTGILPDNNFFVQEIEVPASETIQADTLGREIWFGNWVRTLEKQGTLGFGQALQNSLNERVLSIYTALLCLEDTTLICEECVDETQSIGQLEVVEMADSTLLAWPNPFCHAVKIQVQAAGFAGKGALEIYDASGQLVKRMTFSCKGEDPVILEWDGKNDSNQAETLPGVYLCLLHAGDKRAVLKLVKTD